MSQVYPWDHGTNFAVEIGRQSGGDGGSEYSFRGFHLTPLFRRCYNQRQAPDE